jgi:enoyl-CoA hydratase
MMAASPRPRNEAIERMSDTIKLAIDGPRATITLNNPAKHNRLGPAELTRFKAALDEVDANQDVRLLVITGAGEKTFCAGFDIGSIADRPDASGTGFESLVDRVEAMRMPTLAALNGGVFGGASDLALACDFRLGVRGMRLFVPPARLGLHYYPNGLRRFVERLGSGTAKRMFLLAEEFSDEELLRVGYLDWLVAPSELAARREQIAQQALDLAPLPLAGMKRAINQIARGALDEPSTKAAIAECFRSEDLKEGLAAYGEKRQPKFRGR